MLLGEVTNNYKQNEQKRKKPLKCTEVNNILAVKNKKISGRYLYKSRKYHARTYINYNTMRYISNNYSFTTEREHIKRQKVLLL